MQLLVSALEPSANLHLEPVLDALKGATISGIFDPKFGTPLYASSQFSVMGFLDVLPKIFKAKEAIREMVFLAKEADTVLLIDSPAFNLPLAKAIKAKYPDKKIVYYILPKVWAWNRKRVKKVEAYVDVQASIFPFEKQFYPHATYVGNPLLDEISVTHDPDATYRRTAFLPGSRRGEITKLMPVFRDIAAQIEGEKVVVIPSFFKGRDLAALYGDLSDFSISYEMQESVARSDFAFVCSGTATLEAALIGTPFVLAYKAKALDYFIGSRLVKLRHIGLANIIMDFEGKAPVHQEFLQDAVTPENLLNAYRNFDKEVFSKHATTLREILAHGSAKNVVNLL
ncbi:MAG TPA: lipid-A-disaccharide synthase [Campylobacteraceae bacterium]|nr:lipid-A-disaccharide synthase [Campylobacteraceae bacterium]